MTQSTLDLATKEETRKKTAEVLNRKLEAIQAQIGAYRDSIAILSAQQDDLRRQTALTCPACNEDSQIQDMVYIQTLWYTPPRGCIEGDYWNEGEGQYDCPKCKVRLRLYNLPGIMAMKRLFKEIVKEHDER